MLAEHFRQVFNREFRKQVSGISSEALEILKSWDWPGNVRELRNVIERAMIFADDTELRASDLPELGAVDLSQHGTGFAPDDAFVISKGLTLAEAEKEYIQATLSTCDGSVQRAAEILGISRKNLWEKRKKHGLIS